MLKLRGLEAGYGQVQVLWGIDLDVRKDEITCIVGSNGAGKTTLLRVISGMLRSTRGAIEFDGVDLTNATPATVIRRGIAHVPEGRRLFRGLSVRDNLLLGAYMRPGMRTEIQEDLDFVYELFPILQERQSQDASTLSGGEQQMCAIGRGLMSRPKLLMIDELSLGLAPRAVERVIDALKAIKKNGMTIVIVEQDVLTALELAQQGVVIETGRVVLAGRTEVLERDPRVRQAYLGI